MDVGEEDAVQRFTELFLTKSSFPFMILVCLIRKWLDYWKQFKTTPNFASNVKRIWANQLTFVPTIDDISGKRSLLFRWNSLNTGSEIWRQSLTLNQMFDQIYGGIPRHWI